MLVLSAKFRLITICQRETGALFSRCLSFLAGIPQKGFPSNLLTILGPKFTLFTKGIFSSESRFFGSRQGRCDDNVQSLTTQMLIQRLQHFVRGALLLLMEWDPAALISSVISGWSWERRYRFLPGRCCGRGRPLESSLVCRRPIPAGGGSSFGFPWPGPCLRRRPR